VHRRGVLACLLRGRPITEVEGLPQNAKRAALAQVALRSGVVVRRDL